MKAKKSKISRRSPVQERSKETVDAVLEATAQILQESGASSCSTNMIAERAGVSIGGLYQYFRDKNAILQALCLREREKDLEAIRKCLDVNKTLNIEDLTPKILMTALMRLADRPRLRQILEYELPTGKPEQGLRAIQIQFTKMLKQRLVELSPSKLPGDIEERLQILVHGIEASLYTAIALFGTKLNKEKLVRDTSNIVMFFLSNL